jgi:serine/threonine protein kinase/tetratricopeptide (TPR) repeat protein
MSTLHPRDPLETTGDTEALDDSRRPRRPHLPAGTAIDRYVVVGLLGEGGMGAVYKAFDSQLNRAVALKVIHTDGGDSVTRSGGRDRLLREAQALARLSHPNVLPVYDVGTFGNEVFIATEFVAGQTLRDWLKAETRAPAEVLAVFVAAGQGLGAAHRAGLIHRDFKPENVMVGDDGRVRVLDFGLVRASRPQDGEESQERVTTPPPLPPAPPTETVTVTEKLTPTVRVERERTPEPTPPPPSTPASTPPLPSSDSSGTLLDSPLTELGLIMGTPRYMAPEQHRGEEVDRRTDQFAFAVALYEALYNRQPFAAASAAETKERVLAGDVVDPGRDARVPRRLWPIVARALSVAPAQRFATMEALLAELTRDPESVRRRWLGLGAVTLAALLVAGVALERQQRGLCRGAERNLAGVWDATRRREVRAAFVATRLPYAEAAFTQIAGLFDRYAHDWTAMHTEACEATQLRGEQSPELLDLRMACLGDRLASLGAQVDVLASADAAAVERAHQAAHALPALDECADAAALRAPQRPPADAATRARVADVRKQLGRARALEAAGRYPDGLKVAAATAQAATALHYRPAEAEALLTLGALQNSTGDPNAAAATLRAAALAADAGRADDVRAEALIMLVEVSGEELNHYGDAQTFGEEAEMILQRVEHRDPLLAALERNQGIVFWRQGRYDAAIATLGKALALRAKVFGAEDRQVAETLSDLGDALSDEGKLAEALDDYRRAHAIWVKSLGAEHPQVAVTLNNMANVLANQGQLDEALAQYRHAQAIWEASLGPQHPKVASVLNNIGDTYARLGRYDDALDCYRRALPIFEAAFGPSHFFVGVANVSVSEAERALGHLDAALAANKHGLAILEQTLGPTHPQLAASLCDLGDVYRLRGESAAALAAYRRAQALVEKSPERPELAQALVGMGQLALATNAAGEAVAPLERAVALRERHPGDPLALAAARFALAQALWKAGDRPRASRVVAAARGLYEAAGARGREGLAAVDGWRGRHR